ncbi:MoaF C-terminal domain-containing protein [Microbacterium sp. EST19A]|uniref:MoaF C-terminal domain-containing protein n=1 Tax=Microbacterium sp. EST19A TaxID=2862681 RepID=UPI001CC17922|nr:MoaF C-terminal domain-containing protein [Microbacterium sp. EST19A]
MSTDSKVHAQGFIAQEEWPDVSAMIDGFGAPSLPASEALIGRTIEIRFDDGDTTRYEFHSADAVTSTVIAGARAGSRDRLSYRAVEVRPGVQFIDVLTGSGAEARAISIVVDLVDGRVTAADSWITLTDGVGRTGTVFLSGRIEGMGEIEPRRSSDELVGKRIYYRYSETERYEHIYLNGGTFVWHCISGAESGLADVDQTKTLELAEGLVIFYWKESVMPVESFLVVDLHEKRSIGRMFCWENSTQSVVHIPFDSRFTILNETSYPND